MEDEWDRKSLPTNMAMLDHTRSPQPAKPSQLSTLIQSATGDNGQDLSLINHGHGSPLGTRVGPEFPTTGTGLETVTIKTFPVLGFTS